MRDNFRIACLKFHVVTNLKVNIKVRAPDAVVFS